MTDAQIKLLTLLASMDAPRDPRVGPLLARVTSEAANLQNEAVEHAREVLTETAATVAGGAA